MFPIVRMFASGQKARDVAEELRKTERLDTFLNQDYKPFSPYVLEPAGAGSSGNVQTVRDAVESGILPASLSKACLEGLGRGNYVVVVRCSFGSSADAIRVLDAAGPVDTDRIPEAHYGDAALLSDLLGIPMLTRKSAPLSELFGLPTITEEPTVLGGSTNRFTLSGMLGLPMLTKGAGEWSLGMPTLARKSPTPLSSTLGMPTLTGGGSRETSMGFPLLDRDNPTPLSSLLGLPVLLNAQGSKND